MADEQKEPSTAEKLKVVFVANRINAIKSVMFGIKDVNVQKHMISQAGMFIVNPDDPLEPEELEKLANELSLQVSRQESIAVLHPDYPQSKNDLIHEQVKALRHLALFIRSLKTCDILKGQVATEEKVKDDIKKLFL